VEIIRTSLLLREIMDVETMEDTLVVLMAIVVDLMEVLQVDLISIMEVPPVDLMEVHPVALVDVLVEPSATKVDHQDLLVV